MLWTMGEAHADVLLDRLANRYGVPVEEVELRVPLRETFVQPATGHGRHVKQSGGHGQYAVCSIEVEPLPQGGGFEFVDRVVGGAVPRQFIPSVEKGVLSQMRHGVETGYPMVDIRVILTDGKAHSVDSSDMAFQTAGGLALRDAATRGGVCLLEPVDEVEVLIADSLVGTVMGDLSARRGKVLGSEPARRARHGGGQGAGATAGAAPLLRGAALLHPRLSIIHAHVRSLRAGPGPGVLEAGVCLRLELSACRVRRPQPTGAGPEYPLVYVDDVVVARRRRARRPRSLRSTRPSSAAAARRAARSIASSSSVVAAAGSWPMSRRIVTSVLDAINGSATPSIQTLVRRPSPRSSPVIRSRAKMRSARANLPKPNATIRESDATSPSWHLPPTFWPGVRRGWPADLLIPPPAGHAGLSMLGHAA